MNRAIIILIITFILCSYPTKTMLGQEPKKPKINVDFSQFMVDSSRTKLEIYQSILRTFLSYNKQTTQFIANFNLGTQILQSDSVLFEQTITEADTVGSLDELTKSQQFIYSLPVILAPGTYKVVSSIKDLNNNFENTNKLEINVRSFASDTLNLSDIQLATRINDATNFPTPFDKNNLTITPNPQGLYGNGLEEFTFYAELYNLDESINGNGTYSVEYLIEDYEGNLLYRIPGKKRSKNGMNSAIYASFDISSLQSGRYLLHLVARDDDSKTVASRKKAFLVFHQKDAIAEQEKNDAAIYASLDDPALNKYFSQIAYIADEHEKSVFKELNTQGKRNFLVQFWKRHDPTPNTPKNEFKENYISLLLKAKANFSVGNTEGWETDRGRILLQYGIPDMIDKYEGLSDRNAYEIWNYETLQGVTIFVFIEMRSDGIYQLIHSTYRDEISNPDWRSYLYK